MARKAKEEYVVCILFPTKTQTTIKYATPIAVVRETTLSKYLIVCSPGRTPGIYPPAVFKPLLVSSELKITAVWKYAKNAINTVNMII